jgi:hypothetical protein
MTSVGSIRRCRWGLGSLALLLACGCQTPMEIHSGFGPGVNYTRFGSTFAWWPEKVARVAGHRALNPTLDEFLRQTITDSLVARGYKLQAGEQADFLVDYGVVRKSRGDSSWAPMYEEGSLIIDILDGQSHKPVWRGSATAHLNESIPPPEQKRRIAEAVRRILEGFPQQTAR